MIIRFRHDSLIGLRQQMKADCDSFEVFNNIKERSHCASVSCLTQCDNKTDTLGASSFKAALMKAQNFLSTLVFNNYAECYIHSVCYY